MTNIVDIFKDVVKSCEDGLIIKQADLDCELHEIANPHLTYIFGNAQYIKDMLDEYGKDESRIKFPLIALFCPIEESRDSDQYFSKAKVSLIIACSSTKDWNNEQREHTSFEYILRPIYQRLLSELRKERRLSFGYNGLVKHNYSENYSYGRYGAYTSSGDSVSEPIDAIDIRSLEITVKQPNSCRK